ncbi:MAG: branched-chain amino acid ABC transporter permease [Rhodobiaceae bacterium]|nr:branched-chain amino acid ABC transporter permease [Rhodobiaceae bacterium]MCC0015524.1 branched-chain amino acid ABC transporter permease [Rhodobiaceae bacterium]MCC0040910.1 branched-chain amino acid ABC transporter permease [Rhodobiaceae bacterium]MCC0053237.1 branched-chain amino acid ABC transporter permease [Rhodobiaceae bacterium]
MLYREAGDFKTSYRADQQTFPIRSERILFWAFIVAAFAVVPFFINDYWEKSVLIPFLVWSMAALGLNILVGYCGQVSLGTGGFMAVGAYAAYKLMTAFPEMNILLVIVLSGGVTAVVGMAFGLPSLRIKGFYLAVATLAAQFFLVWVFNKFPWFYNYSASGQITAPERLLFGVPVTGPNSPPWATYLVALTVVFVFAWIGKNLTRGRIGRQWMAIRDMDIAAEIIGVEPLRAKISAFAVSSFYIGIAGAMYFTIWFGAVEPTEAFGINQSFRALFMVIIGGLGSILGSFLGAGFLVLLPVLLKNLMVGQLGWATDIASHFEIMIVGALIIFFLIVEPHGLAQLWRLTKEKLRLWPFPH